MNTVYIINGQNGNYLYHTPPQNLLLKTQNTNSTQYFNVALTTQPTSTSTSSCSLLSIPTTSITTPSSVSGQSQSLNQQSISSQIIVVNVPSKITSSCPPTNYSPIHYIPTIPPSLQEVSNHDLKFVNQYVLY